MSSRARRSHEASCASERATPICEASRASAANGAEIGGTWPIVRAARRLAIARIAIALSTVACVLLSSSASLAASAAVAIDGFRFQPAAVTVNVGDSVTWTNRDAAPHTATAPGAFDTGTLSQGQSRAVTMTAAGTFAYRCSIHTAMTGTVQVVATTAPAPTAAPTAVPPTSRPATPVPTAATTAPPPTAPLTVPPTTTAPPPAATPSTSAPATTAPTATAAPTLLVQASPPSTPGAARPPSGTGDVPGGLVVGAIALAGTLAALAVWGSRRRRG